MNKFQGGSMCNWVSQSVNISRLYSLCKRLQHFLRMCQPHRSCRSHSVQQKKTIVRNTFFIIRHTGSSGLIHPQEGTRVGSRPQALGVDSS